MEEVAEASARRRTVAAEGSVNGINLYFETVVRPNFANPDACKVCLRLDPIASTALLLRCVRCEVCVHPGCYGYGAEMTKRFAGDVEGVVGCSFVPPVASIDPSRD